VINKIMELSDDCIFLLLEKVRKADVKFISLTSANNNFLSSNKYKAEHARISFVDSMNRFLLGIDIGVVKLSDTYLHEYVAYVGQVEIMKYTKKLGKWYWGDTVYNNAICGGHIEMVKYLYEINRKDRYRNDLYRFNTSIASGYGHLEILKYLHEHDCSWNVWSTTEAAKNGHLECLIYLKENRCDMGDYWAAPHAAWGGHLECLKYVLDNGATWNTHNYRYIRERQTDYDYNNLNKEGRPECEQYLEDNGYEL
jgi:hypothetical protein